MKRVIPNNFSLVRYGVHVRLAREEDSAFILSLRSDSLSSVLHTEGNSLEKQVLWMRNYKKREEDGKEYYFIYDVDGVPFALNRIYNITDDGAITGSWVTQPGTDARYSIATLLIEKDIFFEMLHFEKNTFDVRKGNRKVIRLHKWMGAIITSENDEVYYWELSKDNYMLAKNKIKRMFNIYD